MKPAESKASVVLLKRMKLPVPESSYYCWQVLDYVINGNGTDIDGTSEEIKKARRKCYRDRCEVWLGKLVRINKKCHGFMGRYGRVIRVEPRKRDYVDALKCQYPGIGRVCPLQPVIALLPTVFNRGILVIPFNALTLVQGEIHTQRSLFAT